MLPRVVIAIVLGLLLGMVLPAPFVRIFVTFNGIFSSFLFFCIPLIIVGLVAPGIADMEKNAGRLLFITTLIAYGSTLFSGFFTYFSCYAIFPHLIEPDLTLTTVENPESSLLKPFFTIEMLPVFDVMTALVLAFILGIGIALCKGETLKLALNDFKNIVKLVISKVIVPFLPLYIFGIFLNMSSSGTAFSIIVVFGKIIGIIFVLHILLLLIQYGIAFFITGRNPFKLLYTMLPAYMTALGTSSSAATIPVTLAQVKKIGIREDIADFCVPLCATIHLAGSTMKIVAMSLAICILTGSPHDVALFSGLIMMLGIMMIAAPGVPGGAIMAAIGLLQSMLGFDEMAIGLITALYIAIDSFGTACNVTGDGAIAVVVNKIAGVRKVKTQQIGHHLRGWLLLACLFLTASCNSLFMDEQKPNTAKNNFDLLWKIIDEGYCYFEEKDIDWEQIYYQYNKKLNFTRLEPASPHLFNTMVEMLDELHDGHVCLNDGFNSYSFSGWHSSFPENYETNRMNMYRKQDYRTVYLANETTISVLPESIGYIRCPSFSNKFNRNDLDNAMSRFDGLRGVIIDVRNNGGGLISEAYMLASRFFPEKTSVGYVRYKTGKGHNDFSDYFARYVEPEGVNPFYGKIVIITNRRTYSAANLFVSIMNCLPRVCIIGDKTGGGGGMPITAELYNGWTVEFSSNPVFDTKKKSIESGISPDFSIALDKENNQDNLIEAAKTWILAK